MSQPDRAQVIDELWRRGTLRYRMHADQRAVRDQFLESVGRVFVLCCSRRWGKSWLAFALCVEVALMVDGAQIKYAAPTMKMARKIVVPIARKLLADCPADLRPVFNKSELTWTFPNGSEIVLAGCDNGNAENLRGTSCDFAVVDEAGFMGDLQYVVRSILLPQMMTTAGRIFMPSTPARTPTHDFTGYCLEAEASGRYAHRTVYDAPHLTAAVIAEFMAECGGEDTTDWQREYLAQVVVDESIAVLPEFTKGIGVIVREMVVPIHRFTLTAMDGGFEDLFFVLFGYHDFTHDVLVIEDELVFHRQNSGTVAPAVMAREKELWGERAPQTRVLDADAIVRNDMATIHGMDCRLPRKDDKFGAVNATRLALSTGRIAVHPRCKQLIAHCKGAIWNRNRTSFERSGSFGHYDGVDALIYAWRHTDRSANPYPAGYGINRQEQWAHNAGQPEHALAGLVKPLRRR